MEKVKQEFPWISYGDLWTLAGVAAIQEMAGPHIPWRPGRIDGFSHQATPDGRLPDATQGADHLRNIFYRMGYVYIYIYGRILHRILLICYIASMIKKLSLFQVLMLLDAATETGLVSTDLGRSPLQL